MDTKFNFEQLLKKAEELKKSGTADLALEEDLALAIMNLISLEEHFFFTGVKTKRDHYFDLLSEVRELRKELLKKMIDPKAHQGETWCICKHLLAATMRLMEVGTKLQGEGKKKEAKEFFERAHKTFSLFWALRLKLIDPSGFKQVAAKDQPWSLQDIVDKLVDCCDE